MIFIWIWNFPSNHVICPGFALFVTMVMKTKPDFIVDILALALKKLKAKFWEIFEFAISFQFQNLKNHWKKDQDL